jgi:hypothetical protein
MRALSPVATVARDQQAADPVDPLTPIAESRAACAFRMSRREMLGERQVAAPLMAQRAADRALRLAHRRFQPGQGVGIELGGLRLSGKPQRPSHCQFGHQTLVLAFALFAPAASRPGQHCAVRRQRGRQVAPYGHTSTVGQRSRWPRRGPGGSAPPRSGPSHACSCRRKAETSPCKTSIDHHWPAIAIVRLRPRTAPATRHRHRHRRQHQHRRQQHRHPQPRPHPRSGPGRSLPPRSCRSQTSRPGTRYPRASIAAIR